MLVPLHDDDVATALSEWVSGCAFKKKKESATEAHHSSLRRIHSLLLTVATLQWMNFNSHYISCLFACLLSEVWEETSFERMPLMNDNRGEKRSLLRDPLSTHRRGSSLLLVVVGRSKNWDKDYSHSSLPIVLLCVGLSFDDELNNSDLMMQNVTRWPTRSW